MTRLLLTAVSMQNQGQSVYLDPLPSLHIKYNLGKKDAIRLSYFKSVSRPGFFEIVPYVFPGEYYTEVGNYNLKHVQADNIDARYELFPGGSNQFLAGVFYKNIQNPIEYVYSRPATSESVIMPENVGTATNMGFSLYTLNISTSSDSRPTIPTLIRMFPRVRKFIIRHPAVLIPFAM